MDKKDEEFYRKEMRRMAKEEGIDVDVAWDELIEEGEELAFNLFEFIDKDKYSPTQAAVAATFLQALMVHTLGQVPPHLPAEFIFKNMDGLRVEWLKQYRATVADAKKGTLQ